jgi:small subunit ribosomal protein S21
MTAVYNHGNDPIEKMYRIFRKAVEKSGMFADLRKKEFYEKPSVRRRKKHLSAIKRMQRERLEEIEGVRAEREQKDRDKRERREGGGW